jgi:hypothetical protein
MLRKLYWFPNIDTNHYISSVISKHVKHVSERYVTPMDPSNLIHLLLKRDIGVN